MARFDRKIYRWGYRNGGDGATFGLDEDDRTIEHGPGSAHPGAEHGAVGGRLMMRMVPGMFDGLRLSESADGQDTKHKQNRQNFENAVVHRRTAHDILIDDNGLEQNLSSRRHGCHARLALVGFNGKMLYTALITF